MGDIHANHKPQIRSRSPSVLAEVHMYAGDLHEKAAAQYREATKFYAAGDYVNASACVKRAQELGEQAMQHTRKACQQYAGSATGN